MAADGIKPNSFAYEGGTEVELQHAKIFRRTIEANARRYTGLAGKTMHPFVDVHQSSVSIILYIDCSV